MQFDAGALMQQAVENFRSIVAYARNKPETGDDNTSHDPKLPRLVDCFGSRRSDPRGPSRLCRSAPACSIVDLSGFKAHTIAQTLSFATTELNRRTGRNFSPDLVRLG